jgi:methionyl aminopeptidase
MIELRSDAELEKMRAAGKIVAEALKAMRLEAKPGTSTWHLNKIAEEIIRSRGAVPSFLGYGGFPASVCASVNYEVVHGIPSKTRILREGDIIGLDAGAYLDGYHGDAAITVPVGEVSKEARRLLAATQRSLSEAIEVIKPGARIGQVSRAVEERALSERLGIVREYCGHGVGRKLHEDPCIPNFSSAKVGALIKKGMTFAIEPMLNLGAGGVSVLDDNWTIVTKDGSLSAHFEHTVAVTDEGCEILTL